MVPARPRAADGSGGDSRCMCPAWPSDGTAPLIPCDNKTAHVAYILAADPTGVVSPSIMDHDFKVEYAQTWSAEARSRAGLPALSERW